MDRCNCWCTFPNRFARNVREVSARESRRSHNKSRCDVRTPLQKSSGLSSGRHTGASCVFGFCCLLWHSVSTNDALVVVLSSPRRHVKPFFSSFYPRFFVYFQLFFTPNLIADYFVICLFCVMHTHFTYEKYITQLHFAQILYRIECPPYTRTRYRQCG